MFYQKAYIKSKNNVESRQLIFSTELVDDYHISISVKSDRGTILYNNIQFYWFKCYQCGKINKVNLGYQVYRYKEHTLKCCKCRTLQTIDFKCESEARFIPTGENKSYCKITGWIKKENNTIENLINNQKDISSAIVDIIDDNFEELVTEKKLTISETGMEKINKVAKSLNKKLNKLYENIMIKKSADEIAIEAYQYSKKLEKIIFNLVNRSNILEEEKEEIKTATLNIMLDIDCLKLYAGE